MRSFEYSGLARPILEGLAPPRDSHAGCSTGRCVCYSDIRIHPEQFPSHILRRQLYANSNRESNKNSSKKWLLRNEYGRHKLFNL